MNLIEKPGIDLRQLIDLLDRDAEPKGVGVSARRDTKQPLEGALQVMGRHTDNLDQLHRLAGALLEYETLNGEESKRIIAGEDIGRQDPGSARPVLPVAGSSIPSTRKPRGGIGGPAPQGA